jgi:sugar-specific transcriptional regulator TrmB
MNQAKIYLCLLQFGKATGKDISIAAKVARQDVYRILSELQDIGLVEKHVAVPTLFSSVSIEDCLSILIKHKNNEIVLLQDKAEKLIDSFRTDNVERLPHEEARLTLLTEREAVMLRGGREVTKAQTNIEYVTTLDLFIRRNLYFMDIINQALKKGVVFQTVTQKPQTNCTIPKNVQKLLAKKHFQVRFIDSYPDANVGIFDGKLMFTSISNIMENAEYTRIWSDNPSLVALAKGYFEKLWNQGKADSTEI